MLTILCDDCYWKVQCWTYDNLEQGEEIRKCVDEEEMMEFLQESTDGLSKEELEKKKEVNYHKWISENGDFLLRFLEENGFVKRNKDAFGSLPMF